MSSKPSRKRVAAFEDPDSDTNNQQTKKSKKTSGFSTEMQTDADGNPFWEISNKRRLGVSTFKNNVMVSIREFYEKDGQMLPGKKGVTLTTEQFNAVIELLPQIEPVLKEKGVDVVRPEYDQDEAEFEEVVKPVETKKVNRLDKYKNKNKKNHESTSEEDAG
ncbi:uncharacterized protein MYCGRDRAFT_43207 [Zymoseptoria tritici IPO323]|uniref:Transcriptional coactivator p15 (PC4) C-terminal domain-containing protein n=1 Tax=Zymoseptoria tritici (strain CBS 115943 / IPO323) TaxID=336722 RepID=F9XE81_ZYMTI|nr:uncharacterized protein MYCGRDRAFT_43207 [Zymoseptoria tritici IPO323]EGP86695.1 hypothetical protein MYCGRDRAFT_43207 [Zymoseptoria tritici IPO323]